MNTEKFIAAYNASRNGANQFFFNPMYRKMQYSDGVKECAEAGCYWLLDIIGTECLKPLRDAGTPMGVVSVVVPKPGTDSGARLELSTEDYTPPAWTRDLEYTDLPKGEWTFFLADEGERFALILPSEY